MRNLVNWIWSPVTITPAMFLGMNVVAQTMIQMFFWAVGL